MRIAPLAVNHRSVVASSDGRSGWHIRRRMMVCMIRWRVLSLESDMEVRIGEVMCERMWERCNDLQWMEHTDKRWWDWYHSGGGEWVNLLVAHPCYNGRVVLLAVCVWFSEKGVHVSVSVCTAESQDDYGEPQSRDRQHWLRHVWSTLLWGVVLRGLLLS